MSLYKYTLATTSSIYVLTSYARKVRLGRNLIRSLVFSYERERVRKGGYFDWYARQTCQSAAAPELPACWDRVVEQVVLPKQRMGGGRVEGEGSCFDR